MSIARKNSTKTELCIPEGNMKGKGRKFFTEEFTFTMFARYFAPWIFWNILDHCQCLNIIEESQLGINNFQILQGHLPSKRLPHRQVQGKDRRRITTFSKAKLSVKA